MDFLSENPLIILAIILVLMVALVFIFASPKSNDSSKPSSSGGGKDDYISKQTDKMSKKEKRQLRKRSKEVIEKVYGGDAEKQVETLKEATGQEKIDNPEVSGEFKQPYKSIGDGLLQGSEQTSAQTSDDELMKDIEFVPTSSKVARLKRVIPAKVNKIASEAESPSEFDLPLLFQENSEPQKNEPQKVEVQKPKYFDRSQRLSKSIASGQFDDMFKPHISEKYMNMDASRHLKSDDEFSEILLERTSNMLANSGTKTLNAFDDDSDLPTKSYKYDRDMMKEWVERKKREEIARLMTDSNSAASAPAALDESDIDELKLSTRSMFLSDAFAKRKSGKKPV